jgi:hypothetical protein
MPPLGSWFKESEGESEGERASERERERDENVHTGQQVQLGLISSSLDS